MEIYGFATYEGDNKKLVVEGDVEFLEAMRKELEAKKSKRFAFVGELVTGDPKIKRLLFINK